MCLNVLHETIVQNSMLIAASEVSPSLSKNPFRLLFFSRGRGKGHAVPDMSLITELHSLVRDLEVSWASYGTGAATLRLNNFQVVDLGLPDDNPFLETQLRAIRLIAQIRPQLVISHEEFAVAPAAQLLGIPSLLITDYFLRPDHLWMQCLAYATETVFLDAPDCFQEPAFLRGKVHYTGPFVRSLAYQLADRERARHELGIPAGDVVILVLPGGWFTESRAPIFDVVSDAFQTMSLPAKRLVWIAGSDYSDLKSRAENSPGIQVIEADPLIERRMVAADLAITKGTRKTSLELAYLGIPSISLSHGLNPVDDIRVSRILSNSHLRVQDLSQHSIVDEMCRILARPTTRAEQARAEPTGLLDAAQRLARHIAALRI